MSILSNLAVSEDISVSTDRVGGGGPLDSGIYPATVKAVYFKESAGGALSANLHLDIDGREVRQSLWITSGEAKGKRNYYERDGKKHYLPGFELFRALSLMTVGKEPSELTTESGIMKLWDYDSQGEKPTEVPLAKELTGTKVQVGLQKHIVDKSQKNDAGEYVPTGETREQNEIDKFFHSETGQTLVEAMGNADAAFIETWRAKFTGQVIDKTSKTSPTKATAPAAFAQAQPGNAAPVKSLFG